MNRCPISLLLLALGLSGAAMFGAWEDKTVGLPVIETVSAKTMGADGTVASTLQDKFGRLFVCSSRLSVFDGNNWQSFDMPNRAPLSYANMGDDGKLWVGAVNDLGYFQEETLGNFKFHSLLSFLPKDSRNIGQVWGCPTVGRVTYFICRNKLLRWDGKAFQTTVFDTKFRLYPVKLHDEWWVGQCETGLYRLTENGPKLEVTAAELGNIGAKGLFRDRTGLVVVGNTGFIRPGFPGKPFSAPDLNEYLTKHEISAFCELTDGNLVIGTLSGGIVLASRAGQMIRIWDSNSGLPERSVYCLNINSTGEVFGTTPSELFHFWATGHSTLFDHRNGLNGQTVNFLRHVRSTLYAATANGVFIQRTASDGPASFEAFSPLPNVYFCFSPFHDGLLLSRSGGVDWFDGATLHPRLYTIQGDANAIMPFRADPTRFYVGETYHLARMDERPDGSFSSLLLVDLPDSCSNLYEDSAERLWIGTNSKGVFNYNPVTKTLLPINHPTDGRPLPGQTVIVGNERRTVILFAGGILQTPAGRQELRPLENVPALEPLDASYLPDQKEIFVACQRTLGPNGISQGAGVLSFDEHDQPKWRELDIPSLGAIGQVRTLTFSEENNRPILWLGGTEGILRVDYDKIPTLQPPPAPIIKVDEPVESVGTDGSRHAFPFKDHHVNAMVFTGDYARGKDWLIQTRLGSDADEWSPPATRRSFEFTNLSDGNYRFEARAVNSAGMVSAPASFTFTILPPWYRTGRAYAGYAAGLVLAAFGFIRLRERRIRAHNRELETLVNRRTAELVKANAAKDEFLASVSHEIRNPMNGVLAIAESFRTETLDADGQHQFGLLRQCASHLSSLLEDILDFSRVQAGALELEARPFNLPELVESIVAMTAAASATRGMPIEIAISPAVPPQLTGDPRRIRQILLNFVGNALNYAGRGQVSLTVWCKNLGPARTEVFFAVSDEGPGIRPEDRDKLFTRFERGAAARAGRVPGTGLGLALCKTLAEKMGGRVWLESEEGLGSCFFFSAPFAVAAEPARSVTTPSCPEREIFRTALVLDDEEYNRVALTGLLEALGLAVQTADNGAATRALAGSHDFDLVFLDFALPGETGPEIAREIRRLPNRTARAVIFAVTAFNTPDKRALCFAAGMDAFLGKPVTMDRLRQALAAVSPMKTPPPTPPDVAGPAGPLSNLRLLAANKNISFAEELALYFAELATELARLTVALQQEAAIDAAHFAHLLCGRCAFINERELERALRQTGAAITAGRWDDARRLGREVGAGLAELQVRLTSPPPVAPPASDR